MLTDPKSNDMCVTFLSNYKHFQIVAVVTGDSIVAFY